MILLLATPESFDREMYVHCFRIVGRYWLELSDEMRYRMCRVVNIVPEEAQLFLTQQIE